MADRQSQGLQIALIAAVMLDIVFGVVAYLMWRQFDEQKTVAAASDKKAGDAQTETSKALGEAKNLKEWIGGFAPTDSIDTIQKAKDADMTAFEDAFPKGYPQADRVYRKVVKTLYDAVKNRERTIADAQKKQADAELQSATLLNESATKLKAEETNTADVRKERDKQKEDFDSQRKQILDDQNKLAERKKDAEAQAAAKAAELDSTRAAYDARDKESRQRIADLKHDIEQEKKQTFEVPLGKVISVNQAQQIVYINLGEADSLGRLTSFTVYDAKTSDVTRGGKKATIEVTQLTGPHQAEAHIVDGKPGNPVLAGDVIYTPVWRPGQKRHFALVGLIDVDGDKRSDLDLVRNLIATNGGVVDSYREGNKRLGKMTAQTDYLIVGSEPDTTSGTKADFTDFTNMQNQADRDLVKKVTLKDFLDKIGWRAETTLQKYGPGYRAQDFAPQPYRGAQPLGTGNVSPLFKPRQPQSGTTGTY